VKLQFKEEEIVYLSALIYLQMMQQSQSGQDEVTPFEENFK
jgi:hypothetical protein